MRAGLNLFWVLLLSAVALHADEQEVLGTVQAEIVFASSDISEEGNEMEPQRRALLEGLESLKGLRFRSLGKDQQQLMRSYVNWLKPLGASKLFMVEFDMLGVKDEQVRLTLKLWQHDKVILKTDIALRKGKPLIIQGPAWRGGRVLVMIDLVDLVSGS